jgi:hypothetical protein
MKKTIIVTLISFFFSVSLYAAEKKNDTTEKSRGQDTLIEKLKKNPIKLNKKSKLTDWITGKKKFSDSVPNPINGLKSIKKAVTPANPLKK